MSFPAYLIAYGNRTAGRDKLCRLFQYTFRALSDLLDRLDHPDYATTIKKFKKLEFHLSNVRKVLRIGKSLEMFYLAKQALYIEDTLISRLVGLSRTASGCFLFLDHIIWLQRAKTVNIDIKPISDLANRFWLLSSLLNLWRNAYDWSRIRSAQVGRDVRRRNVYVPQKLPVLLDTVKNILDLLVPLNSLKMFETSGLVIGTTGAISSAIGIATVWNDQYKLINK